MKYEEWVLKNFSALKNEFEKNKDIYHTFEECAWVNWTTRQQDWINEEDMPELKW